MPPRPHTVRCLPPSARPGDWGYLLSTAVQALVRSEIVAAYGECRRHREMSKPRDHYIICGPAAPAVPAAIQT